MVQDSEILVVLYSENLGLIVLLNTVEISTHMLLYFSLDRKVPKDQDCEKFVEILRLSLSEINSPDFVGIKQYFTFNARVFEFLIINFSMSGNSEMKLSKNFRLKEFVVSQTAERNGIDNRPNEDQVINLWILVYEVLQPLRDLVDCPVMINSGFRCPDVNRLVGGSVKSQHMDGKAADLIVPDMDSNTVIKLIVDKLEFDQVILEYGRWIHVSFNKDQNRGKVMKAELVNGRTIYTTMARR